MGRLLETVEQNEGQKTVKKKMEKGKIRTKEGGRRPGGNMRKRKRRKYKEEED